MQDDQGTIGIVDPSGFDESTLGQMAAPLCRAVGRHDEVNEATLRSPDVEVLPFENGVQRSAYMKGERVRFGAEKDDGAIGASANIAGVILPDPTLARFGVEALQIDDPANASECR